MWVRAARGQERSAMTVDLRIVAPILPVDRDACSVKYCDPMKVIVELDLDEPWFTVPNLGRRLSGQFDGDNEPAYIFETRIGVPVKAFVGGRTTVHDTGRDDHSGAPVRTGNPALRGCEVVVKNGAFEISYSHLKRGSAFGGSTVKLGDVVGLTGNTGRCLDGAKRGFVRIAVKSKSIRMRLDEFCDPITIDGLFNEKPLFPPVCVAEGELLCKNVKLEEVYVDPDNPDLFKRGDENVLEVVARRGDRVIARRKGFVKIDF
jgi:hypothetical protein